MQYLSRDWNLIFRPFACEVYADAGHDGGGVAKAHRRQVQWVGRHEIRRLGQLLWGWNKRNEIALRPTIAIHCTHDTTQEYLRHQKHQSGACMSARTFDKLTAFDNMGVRMVDGNVEAKGLEQDVLIAHQLLGLQMDD